MQVFFQSDPKSSENLLNQVLSGVVITDSNGVIEYVNHATEAITGCFSAELVGKHLFRDFKGSSDPLLPYYEQARLNRFPVAFENLGAVTPEGRESYLSGWLFPQYRGDHFDGMVLVGQDVTRSVEAEHRIQQCELRAQMISEMISDYVYGAAIGPEREITIEWASGAFERITGYGFSELLAMPGGWSAIIDPAEVATYRKQLSLVRPGHQAVLEYRIRRKDGHPRWVRDYFRLLSGNGDGPKSRRLVGAVQDITAQRHAREALEQANQQLEGRVQQRTEELERINEAMKQEIGRREQSEAELRREHQQLISLFDSIDEVIYVADPETYELLYVNEAFRRYWGDAVGQKCHKVLQNLDQPCPFCTNHLLFGEKLGEAHIWEFQNTVNQRWYRCIDKAIQWPDGRWVRYEMAIDFHDRHEAEACLQQSQERYKLVADFTYDWETFINAEGLYDYVSPSCERITGYPAERFLADPHFLASITVPEDRARILDYFQACNQRKQEVIEFEYRIVRPDGDVRWVHHISNPVFDDAGQWQGRRGSNRDITDQKRILNELRRSEAHFRTLVDNIPGVTYLCRNDQRYTMLYLNDRVQELTGIEADGFLSDQVSLDELFHPEDRDRVHQEVDAAVMAHKRFHLEYRIEHRDKGWRWVEEYGQGIYDDDGRLQYLEGTIFDVTDRKATTEALQKNQQQFQAIMDNSVSIIFLKDRQGRYLYINRQYERMFGLKVADALGKTDFDLVDERMAKRFLAGEEQVYSTGLPIQFEEGYMEGDRRRSFFTTKFPMVDSQGHIYGLCGIVTEITDRKQAEDSLRESERRFRLMADTAPVMIAMTNPAGEMVFFNEQWLLFTGICKPEELGAGWFEGVHPEDLPALVREHGQAIREKRGYSLEYRYRQEDGSYRWLLDRGVPRLTPDGIYQGHVSSAVDITKNKQATQQLRCSLEEKELLLKEVHHRVKNNLQLITSLLSLQMEHHHDKTMESVFQECQSRIRAIASIHQRLCQPDSLARVDLSETIESLCRDLKMSFGSRAANVVIRTELEPVFLTVDKSIPCGLIVNELLSNALKYAFGPGASGTVTVKLKQDTDGWVTVGVEDDGRGFLPRGGSEPGSDSAGSDAGEIASVGMRLISALIRQLRGESEWSHDHGTRFTLRFRT